MQSILLENDMCRNYNRGFDFFPPLTHLLVLCWFVLLATPGPGTNSCALVLLQLKKRNKTIISNFFFRWYNVLLAILDLVQGVIVSLTHGWRWLLLLLLLVAVAGCCCCWLLLLAAAGCWLLLLVAVAGCCCCWLLLLAAAGCRPRQKTMGL